MLFKKLYMYTIFKDKKRDLTNFFAKYGTHIAYKTPEGVMMQFLLSKETLNIQTNNSEVYYKIQQVVDKNFPNRIGRKDKIILFADQNETHQRRYFLKFIATLYKSYGSEPFELEELENFYDKTIKIILVQENQLLPRLKLQLFFQKDMVYFALKTENKMLLVYLKNFFKEHGFEYEMQTKVIKLYPKSQNFTLMLEQLLEEERHLAWILEFEYNKDELESFKNSLNDKFNKLNRFSSLEILLKEHFDTLGCDISDPHEKVRRRYLDLIKLYHPDRHQNVSSEVMQGYIEHFQKIQDAYEIVKNYYSKDDKYFSA